MLQVELRGGVFIHVGWYPARNHTGQYRVIIFRNTVDDLLFQISTTSLATVKAVVYEAIERYGSESVFDAMGLPQARRAQPRISVTLSSSSSTAACQFGQVHCCKPVLSKLSGV